MGILINKIIKENLRWIMIDISIQEIISQTYEMREICEYIILVLIL